MKVKSESEVSQSCPTLSDTMDCSPPGSSVHGIFQARVLEWGAIAFSRCGAYQLPNIDLKVKVLVAGSCLTLCNPVDCSPPGSSVHEILQARIMEWVAIPFSRRSSRPRNRTQVSCTAGRFFITEPPGSASQNVFNEIKTELRVNRNFYSDLTLP